MSLAQMKISACLGGLAISLALSHGAEAADVVIRNIAGGSGDDAVGIVAASTDTEVDGPQALTSDADGKVYLLDQVNGRIVKFDPKSPSAAPRILQLPGALRPTDLIVRKTDILVWDGSVHTLQPTQQNDSPSFRGLEEVNTRAADDQTVVSAFAQMGSSDPGDATDLLDQSNRSTGGKKSPPRSRQHIATLGSGSVYVDVIPEDRGSAARIEVNRDDGGTNTLIAHLSIKVHDQLGAVEFLEIDHSGRMFVLAENIPNSLWGAGAFVARYSPSGALEGIYELPLSNVPLSRRFVTVSAEGDVYFLRTQNTGVEVLGVGFRPLPAGAVIDVSTAASSTPLQAFLHGPITAVRPLTRQQVVETAFAFEGLQWRVNPGAYGRDPDQVCTGFGGRVRRPFYLHGKIGQEVRGIPYCWGCYGSLDQIRNKIEHGVLAGNICTHNAPRADVAGVDCSAFVSACWGLAHQFTTSAIPAITQPVTNPWDLRPGDALDKPGSHVMLFLRFTPDRMAEVMESSPGACNGRVCRNIYPLGALLARGYQPVRFRALVNDASLVAQVAPPENPEPTAKQGAPKVRRRKH